MPCHWLDLKDKQCFLDTTTNVSPHSPPIIQKGNNSLKNGLIYLVSGYAYHMAIGNHAKFEESTFKM
jgi:hypothetical protein